MIAKAPAWPADKVERRAVSSLKPYAKNSRTHSAAQIEQIARSITEFGFTMPVLIDPKGGIIAGHGRVLAAESLGLADVPVMVAKGWTAAQKRAYVIADNKLALNAGWDEGILSEELKALGADGFDLSLTGFDNVELVSLLSGAEGETDPDDVPEPPAEPVSRLGDVWICGDHRVICGDSTDADTVATMLDGAKPHLMVTDPPYGVNYDPNWRNEPEKLNLKSATAFKTRKAAKGIVHNDDRSDWTETYRLFPGDVAYVWHGERQGPELVGHWRECGFEPRNLIVWAKDSLVISRGHYHPQHEGCWYLVRKGATAHWSGDRKQATLWSIPKNRKNETGHGTQKPVECMKRPIENNSRAGDAVYDPFLGSGTTMIAAEMTGRKCYGIELSPAYVDVIVSRWEAFTGRKAVLMVDGSTFTDLAAQRAKVAA